MKKLFVKWLGLEPLYGDLRKDIVEDLKDDLHRIYVARLERLERKLWDMEQGKNSERTTIADAARNQVDEFVNNEEFLRNIVTRIKSMQV